MKLSAAKLKDKAREVHYNRWGSSAMVTILFLLIYQGLTFLTSLLIINESTLSTIIAMIMDVIISLLMFLFSCGCLFYFMNMARGIPSGIGSIFKIIKMQPDRYIMLGLFFSLVSEVLLIPNYFVLIRPGTMPEAMTYILVFWNIFRIVFLYYYTLNIGLAPMIMLDNPDFSAPQAVKASILLMRGNKFRLFRLHLSFIGWILLAIMSFMISAIWILPYFTETVVMFYIDVLPQEEG